MLAAGALTALFDLPLLPIESFIALQQWIGVKPSTGERLKLGVLPVYFADMFGWPELAEVVGQAYQALPPQDRERAVFFGRNYGEAAAVDFFGQPWGLPPAISGHENYFLWGPRGHDGSVMLILGGSRDDLLKDFRSVEPVGRWEIRSACPRNPARRSGSAATVSSRCRTRGRACGDGARHGRPGISDRPPVCAPAPLWGRAGLGVARTVEISAARPFFRNRPARPPP